MQLITLERKIYDIVLALLPILIRLARPFSTKASLMVSGRRNWKFNLSRQNLKGKKCWIHCASLGEFEQGRPLIEAIKARHPHCSIIITFFSSSGYEIQKDYALADYVCYLPFDGRKTSKAFIEVLNPDITIFVKYEFWYYYLTELKRRNVPVFSISSIFRRDQQFFRRHGRIFQEMLACFTYFFVQNESSRALLSRHGFENALVSGDTRFDRVLEICSHPRDIDIAERFKAGYPLLVVGSSWPEDIDVLLPLINNRTDDLRFIIAPHEISENNIRKLCQKLKVPFQLYSKTHESTLPHTKVLIIDSIGLLSSLYKLGEVAYIGGAFGDGLHNILEAATFGVPVIFGKSKKNAKYQEATDLLHLGGAFEISDSLDVADRITKLFENKHTLEHASSICYQYVRDRAGATSLIMEHLEKYLD